MALRNDENDVRAWAIFPHYFSLLSHSHQSLTIAHASSHHHVISTAAGLNRINIKIFARSGGECDEDSGFSRQQSEDGVGSLDERFNNSWKTNVDANGVEDHQIVRSESTLFIHHLKFNTLDRNIDFLDCKCPPDPPKLETNVWTEITSPNYPQVYCPNMNCQYFLTAPAGYKFNYSSAKIPFQLSNNHELY